MSAPPHEPQSDRDTLRVSVFRLFEVNASGRGIYHARKLVPLVLWGAIAAAVVVTALTILGLHL